MVYVTCLHPTAHSRAIDLSMTKKQLVLPEKTLKQSMKKLCQRAITVKKMRRA